mgnify:CR=1 FL=1
MGQTEQDVMHDYRGIARRVTVSSFYIDETEVSNIDYLEYLFWLQRVHASMPQLHRKALPDTLVWLEDSMYNYYINYYFRHPSTKNSPVVGIAYEQAVSFCK